MSVTEKPLKFTTDDGSEFNTKEEAEAHDARLEAFTRFTNARDLLIAAFAAEMKTADGHLFEPGSFFWVQDFPWPTIFELHSTGWQAQDFRMEDGELVLIERYGEQQERHHRIGDLYMSHRAAKAALKEKLIAKIADIQTSIDRLPS